MPSLHTEEMHAPLRLLCLRGGGSLPFPGRRREEIQKIYDQPLITLILEAARIHGQNFNPREVQKSTLLSIKTGGCPETCTYCSQSSSWKKETGLQAEKLMDLDSVFEMAVRAKESGSTRFCMGAAWRGPSQVTRSNRPNIETSLPLACHPPPALSHRGFFCHPSRPPGPCSPRAI